MSTMHWGQANNFPTLLYQSASCSTLNGNTVISIRTIMPHVHLALFQTHSNKSYAKWILLFGIKKTKKFYGDLTLK